MRPLLHVKQDSSNLEAIALIWIRLVVSSKRDALAVMLAQEEILRAFEVYDKNGDGLISKEEFVAILTRNAGGHTMSLEAAEVVVMAAVVVEADTCRTWQGIRREGLYNKNGCTSWKAGRMSLETRQWCSLYLDSHTCQHTVPHATVDAWSWLHERALGLVAASRL